MWWASGMSAGSKIPIVPQEVPVAKATAAANKNVSSGSAATVTQPWIGADQVDAGVQVPAHALDGPGQHEDGHGHAHAGDGARPGHDGLAQRQQPLAHGQPDGAQAAQHRAPEQAPWRCRPRRRPPARPRSSRCLPERLAQVRAELGARLGAGEQRPGPGQPGPLVRPARPVHAAEHRGDDQRHRDHGVVPAMRDALGGRRCSSSTWVSGASPGAAAGRARRAARRPASARSRDPTRRS